MTCFIHFIYSFTIPASIPLLFLTASVFRVPSMQPGMRKIVCRNSKKVGGVNRINEYGYLQRQQKWDIVNRRQQHPGLQRRWMTSNLSYSEMLYTRNLLRNKKAMIIDCDGVLYHGDRLLPGVKEFVNFLKSQDKKYLFLTNASDKSGRLNSVLFYQWDSFDNVEFSLLNLVWFLPMRKSVWILSVLFDKQKCW